MTVPESRRLVVFDADIHGHHAHYLRWIADGARQRGIPLLVVAPPHLQCLTGVGNAFKRDFAAMGSASEDSRALGGLWRRQFSAWSIYHTAAKRLLSPSDMVLVPYADTFTYAAALFGSPFGAAHWSCVSMRAPFDGDEWSLPVRIKRQLYLRFLGGQGHPKALYLNDRTAYEALSARPLACDVQFLPDPVETCANRPSRGTARACLNLDEADSLVLVYGSITHRKGVRLLLDTLSQQPPELRLKILLAGRQDAAVTEYLHQWRRSHPNLAAALIEWNRMLNRSEETVAFAAADIAWLVYENHAGMSGVLVQAAKYGVPAIVSRNGLMGRYAREQDAARALPADTAEHALQALRELREPRNRRRLCECAAKSFAAHTVENFQSILLGPLPSDRLSHG